MSIGKNLASLNSEDPIAFIQENEPFISFPKSDQTTELKSIPPAKQVAEAKRQIAEIFEKDYKAALKEKGLLHQRRLLAVAERIVTLLDGSSNAATEFAVFEIGLDIMRQSCFADSTLELITRFENTFKVNGLELRLNAFEYWQEQIPKYSRAPKERRAAFLKLAQLAKPNAAIAVSRKQWSVASSFATLTQEMFTLGENKREVPEFNELIVLMQRLSDEESKFKNTLEQLKSNPKQPELQYAVGSYMCFVMEDWVQGLPYLFESNNSAIAEIAGHDLSATDTTYEKIGDLWWNLAESKESDAVKKHSIRRRACHFYSLTLPKTSGITKVKLERRISETESLAWRVFELGRPLLTNSESTRMEFVLIESGEFYMGSSASQSKSDGTQNEAPRHRVKITRPFYFGKYEVTQKQWKDVMGPEPWGGKPNVRIGADYPASYISWNAANEFCKKLSTMDNSEYRLPTEAEWEYTCRAGNKEAYGFGETGVLISVYDWVYQNCRAAKEMYAHRVGDKAPNPWGLFNMHGNLTERCQDYYSADFYRESPSTDPINLKQSPRRIRRGGAFTINIYHCAARGALPPADALSDSGFSCLTISR